jgi:hypothetical protein
MSSTKTFWVATVSSILTHTWRIDPCSRAGSVDLAVIVQADVGLHGVVEIGVGGLGVGSSRSALIPVRVSAVRSTVMVTFVS